MVQPKEPLMDMNVAMTRMANEVERLVLQEGVLSAFRKRCTAFAEKYRKYAQIWRLWRFETSGYAEATKDEELTSLRTRKREPGVRTRKAFVTFMKSYVETFARSSLGLDSCWVSKKQDYEEVYFDPEPILKYLTDDEWPWRWQTFENVDSKSDVTGWTPALNTCKPEPSDDPWPFYPIPTAHWGDKTTDRPFDPENDLDAMYVLLSLCHDAVMSNYRLIITDEIRQIVPDIDDLWPGSSISEVEAEYLRDALNVVKTNLTSVESGEAVETPPPLPDRPRLIYEKLCSLQPHEAMTGPDLLNWLAQDHDIFIDGKTLRQYLTHLGPYGLKNKPRAGYYLRPSK